MNNPDFIIISQSDVVNYEQYSKLPLNRLSLYSNLIYLRMVYYKNAFRSHLDIINDIRHGMFWVDANYPQRRKLLSVWNVPGFNGIHLANYLKQYGIETFIVNNFDAEWDIFCEVYDECENKPLVGISTTFHLNYSEISRLTKRLTRQYPDISIVLGGAFANNEMKLNGGASLEEAMKKLGIEFALHGFNSEVDLKDLLLLRKKGDFDTETVNNLLYLCRDNSDCDVRSTKTIWNKPLVEDVPSFRDKITPVFVNNTIQMRTSSGCPFKCAFCTYPQTAGGFYTMSSEMVEKQIHCVLGQTGVDKIIFLDDTLNIPVERFKELCKIFAKYDFEWFSFLRVQFIDKDIARMMKESGCRGVYLGIESANDNILKNMNKRATKAEFAKGIECLQKVDITTIAAFVLGFPGETEGTILDNIKFIETCGIDFYTLKEFYYMKDAPIYQNRADYGLTGIGAKWSHNTMDSTTAFEHKISMFKEIKNSVFIDPDTSLWYLAYLYDQGFSMKGIASFQKDINALMMAQLSGDFSDDNPIYGQMRQKLNSKECLKKKQ